LKILEKILVIIILIVLVFPAIQKEYPVFQVKKLDGDFVLAEKPVFSWTDWYKGGFQISYDKYLEDHIGFRDFLVRLTNQIDYSLFRIPHAEGVLVGKNNQLFEYDYIRAYVGEDFIGEENIDKKIRKLKFIQEYLKEERNIDLILVFEPGKASFYPENIPDRYLDNVSANTNFNSFLKKAIEHEIKFIDFKAYFNSIKGTTKYPLYPQYGIHWSVYGMSYAADSLISYIEDLRTIDLPEYYIDSLQVETYSRRPDYDVGKTLNLLFRLREKEKLAYPVYRFEDNTDKDKPMVLTIADSYYWNIFNTRIPKNLFQNEAFWYFNKQIYPDSYYEPKHVGDINLKEEIEKQDVIFLMITERFLFKFGWNFIEDVFKLYGPTSVYNKMHDYKCKIWNYNVWFTGVIEDAKERNLSLEEMLELVAEYVYSQDNLEDFLMYKGPNFFAENINRDPSRLKTMETKAGEYNIVVDTIIQREANNIFQSKHPEILKNYNELENFKFKIVNDSLLLSDAQQYTKKYYLTLKESIQIKAEKMYQQSASNDN
jgi:hypothetical protein